MKLTLMDVVNEARRVVADKGPDFVYDNTVKLCSYYRDGEPSCAVGFVLDRRIGQLFRAITDDRDENGLALNYAGARSVLSRLLDAAEVGDPQLYENARVGDFLENFQRKQDDAWTWGEAFDYAASLCVPTDAEIVEAYQMDLRFEIAALDRRLDVCDELLFDSRMSYAVA